MFIVCVYLLCISDRTILAICMYMYICTAVTVSSIRIGTMRNVHTYVNTVIFFAYVLQFCLFLFDYFTICCRMCNRSCYGSANIYRARLPLKREYLNKLGNWHVDIHAHFYICRYTLYLINHLFKTKEKINEMKWTKKNCL